MAEVELPQNYSTNIEAEVTAQKSIEIVPQRPLPENGRTGRQNVEIARQRLRDAILRGELPAGVPLTQSQLEQQLGIGRTPLREAIRLLQHEGLIDAEPNRRVRVTEFSVSEMEQIYAERILLEVLGIRLTVPRLTTDELCKLEEHLIGIEHFSMIKDYERWLIPHTAFHRGLVAYTGRRLLTRIRQLSDHAERYRRFYTLDVQGAWTVGAAEHRAIYEACVERDPVAAGNLLARHYARVSLSTIAMVAPAYDPAGVRAALRMVEHVESPEKRGGG